MAMEETDFSATVGRNANRTNKALFVINGKEYQIHKNDNGKNNLHCSFEESGKNVMAGVVLSHPPGKPAAESLSVP